MLPKFGHHNYLTLAGSCMSFDEGLRPSAQRSTDVVKFNNMMASKQYMLSVHLLIHSYKTLLI